MNGKLDGKSGEGEMKLLSDTLTLKRISYLKAINDLLIVLEGGKSSKTKIKTMKRNLYSIVILLFLFASCSSTRNSIANTPKDIALLSSIKKLDKSPADTALRNNLSNQYNNASKIHLNNIDVYSTLMEPGKWNKIIREYQALQHLSGVINSSSNAAKFLNVPSYEADISAVKEKAAADYYAMGIDYLNNNDKQSSRDAYRAFKESQDYVAGYKDTKRQMDLAYQGSILNVIVNPVTDNSYYYNNTGFNRFGNSFNNDYLQRSLVRDLGGDYTRNSFERFYTDWEAQRANVQPDIFVDLIWQNLDIPQPYTSRYTRNVSKQIEIGRDTSGHVTYQTVSGTLSVTKKYFTATGDLGSRITDAATRNNIADRRYTAQFNWQQEYASYRGDSRALSGNDLALLQNTNFQVPSKQDILNELYQRIYPQVKNGIHNAVR
ncbi:MAG: hypothetical protein ABIN25_02350 [Ginsengibacter sp.]